MATIRRNAAALTAADWQRFTAAVDALHGTAAPAPAYRAFVAVHVQAMSMAGMSWGVHTMPAMGMVGRNFLAWHRRFLRQFELRLQQQDATVAIPYWDWIAHPVIPSPLADPVALARWSVVQHWTPTDMPTAAELGTVLTATTFAKFQRRLELGPHADVHVAVGGEPGMVTPGTMNSASSPADPVFWLHHANIDRLWVQWQQQHPTATPSNGSEVLHPDPMFAVSVTSQLDVAALGYAYA